MILKEKGPPDIPELYGLVLAGGDSRRMGKNKALLVYNRRPQVFEAMEILKSACSRVFISCKKEQSDLFVDIKDQIFDNEEVKGPMAGIHAALNKHPDKAWVTLPCDLPRVNIETIMHLVSERNPDRHLTTWIYDDHKLEPLVSIWEPTVLPKIKTLSRSGDYSLVNVINSCKTKYIQIKQPEIFLNINYNREYRNFKDNL